MADAIVQHLDAVRGFLGHLGDSRAVAKVAGAQKVHLEQLLTTVSVSIVDAMKVALVHRKTVFTQMKPPTRNPKPWTLNLGP